MGIGNHENEQVTSVIFLLNSQNVSISGTKDRKNKYWLTRSEDISQNLSEEITTATLLFLQL